MPIPIPNHLKDALVRLAHHLLHESYVSERGPGRLPGVKVCVDTLAAHGDGVWDVGGGVHGVDVGGVGDGAGGEVEGALEEGESVVGR